MSTPNDDLACLRGDERGAIMVMGIFMCTCLVGALWYLASIGDSILYRERMQEASDAIVFSDAVLHARGMNLIVLINLIMACVLGIRVALKIAQLICAVAGVVFAVIGIFAPPFASAAGVCFDAVVQLEQAIKDTRKPINDTLKALTGTQTLISRATPAGAFLGATQTVGGNYKPFIQGSLILDAEIANGLPLEKGREDKLCGEAGASLAGIFKWLLDEIGLGVFGPATEWLGDKMKGLASAAPGYFCEMGTIGGSPDAFINGMFDDAANERCKDGGPVATYDDAESKWQAACAAANVTCVGDSGSDRPVRDRTILERGEQSGYAPPGVQRELDELRAKRDAAAKSANEYLSLFRGGLYEGDEDMCRNWAKAEAREEFNKKLKSEPSEKTDTEDMTGKRLVDRWSNGGPDAQFVGGVTGDTSLLERSVQFVRIAAFDEARRNDVKTPIAAKVPAWTQAELFFDCESTWGECNRDDDAMWHLKWRARLRRYDGSKPLDRIVSILALGASLNEGYVGMKSVVSNPGFSDPINAFVGNTRLRAELVRVVGNSHVMNHGIH